VIYLLIFAFMSDPYPNRPLAVGVAEFNSLEACQAAAREVARQANATGSGLPLLVCTAKGQPTKLSKDN